MTAILFFFKCLSFFAGIVAVVRRMSKPKVTVGNDGSLYKFHPKFNERMTDMLDQLIPETDKVRKVKRE